MLGFVDTLIAGQISESALASVGIGNAIFTGATILGFGIIAGLDPIVSQAVGANRRSDATSALASALMTAALLVIPFAFFVLVGGWLGLTYGGFDEATSQGVFDYLSTRIYSVAPLYLQAAFGSFLQGHGDTKPLFVSAVLVNLLNVPLSLCLAMGARAGEIAGVQLAWLGEGAGVGGIGLATSIVSTVRMAILALYVKPYVTSGFLRLASIMRV